MPKPEISRRCPECGASIRMRARACPRCGRNFARAPSGATPDSADKQSKVTAQPPPSTRLPVDKRMGRTTDSSAQQTAAASRDAWEDNVHPQFEKDRHVSNVMLDEAGYDSSLRFVLVAAILFVLFLVLLLLSKWLR